MKKLITSVALFVALCLSTPAAAVTIDLLSANLNTVQNFFTNLSASIEIIPGQIPNPITGGATMGFFGGDFCRRQPKHAPVTGIHVNNQFGPEQLETKAEAELCLPSQANPG